MPVVQEWLALVTADDALAATFAADAAASAADAAATVTRRGCRGGGRLPH